MDDVNMTKLKAPTKIYFISLGLSIAVFVFIICGIYLLINKFKELDALKNEYKAFNPHKIAPIIKIIKDIVLLYILSWDLKEINLLGVKYINALISGELNSLLDEIGEVIVSLLSCIEL